MNPEAYNKLDSESKKQIDDITRREEIATINKRLYEVENQLKGLLVSLVDELKAERAKGNVRIAKIEKELENCEDRLNIHAAKVPQEKSTNLTEIIKNLFKRNGN